MTKIIKHFKYSYPTLFLLLAGLVLSGQSGKDIPSILRQKFQKWVNLVPWEEIYVHTDRSDYIAGEDLWFNIYLIDRSTMRSGSKSRIAYFELLNAENKPVVQKRILIDQGSGPGNIQIPDTLSSGQYTMIAYTNYMKNFLPENCFVKQILIYNVLNQNMSPSTRMLQNLIGAKPVLQQKEGVILEVSRQVQDTLKIKISVDDAFRKDNNDLIYLLIQTHGILNHIDSVRIKGQTTLFTLPVSDLSEGLNNIVAFDSKGRFEGEIYTLTLQEKETGDRIIGPDSAGIRNAVPLEIDTGSGISNAPDLTAISISVAPRLGHRDTDLKDYLLFGSEFGDYRRFLPDSGKTNSLEEKTLYPILQDLHSNWIDWEKIVSERLPDIKYQPESADHFLTGSIIDMDRRVPLPRQRILMFTPGRQPEFQYAVSDEKGSFILKLHIDEEKKEFILMPDQQARSYRIITRSPFQERSGNIMTLKVSDTIPSYIEDLSTNYQVRKMYGASDTSGFMVPVAAPQRKVRFYGKPDIELLMADYVLLPRMDEVFFEILPHVSMKKRSAGYEVAVTDRVANTRLEFSPVLLIDGVRIDDASLIAGLDPSIVDRIDVINGMYRIGSFNFTGLVNVITKNANFTDVPLDDNMTRLTYKVIDPVPLFSSPSYPSVESRESPVPDFRNTLWWAPSVKPGKGTGLKVKFWTSDIPGDYRISVQGFNRAGKLISVSKILTVR